MVATMHPNARATEYFPINVKHARAFYFRVFGTGFMNSGDYDFCVENMRHKSTNLLFGLPVVMDTNNDGIKAGDSVLLKYLGQDIGVMTVGNNCSFIYQFICIDAGCCVLILIYCLLFVIYYYLTISLLTIMSYGFYILASVTKE